jgi:hypothetical protein
MIRREIELVWKSCKIKAPPNLAGLSYELKKNLNDYFAILLTSLVNFDFWFDAFFL